MTNLRNGVKRARGGKRAGSGRKTKAATKLRKALKELLTKIEPKEILKDGMNEAQFAFSFLCATMRSPVVNTDIRRQAAKDVLDRVLGKPEQGVTLKNPGEAILVKLDK